MLNIPLSPEKEARLRAQALARGQDVAEYVLEVLDEELAAAESPTDPASQSEADAWLSAFRAWVRSHPPVAHPADDSRDSIYAARGE